MASTLFAVVCLGALGLFAGWAQVATAGPVCDVRLHPEGDAHDAIAEASEGARVQHTGDDSVFQDPSITSESNTYQRSRGTRFLWDDTELNAAGWRAVGHDVDGKFLP